MKREVPKVKDEIDQLFLRFSSIYGPLWNSRFPNSQIVTIVKNEWANGLAKFEPQQILEAIEYCSRCQEMVPTLPKFVGFCRRHPIGDFDFAPMLEVKRSDPIVARNWLRVIRAHLSNGHQQKGVSNVSTATQSV